MQLGQITPANAQARLPAGTVTSSEKAAIVVRFLMNEGAHVPIDTLLEGLQAELTHQMGSLRRIDSATLVSVIEELATELEETGLTFPKGVAGALSELVGKISPGAAARIRKRTGVRAIGDPWEQLFELEAEKLLSLIENESIEVAAVLLSKIDVKKAATMLRQMLGERARRITYAVSLTNSVTPDAVDRIGRSLISQLDDEPILAFTNKPEERLGAILNSSRSMTRDELLDGLDEADQSFAAEVRKAIFTFKHIAERVDERDVPAVLKSVDNDILVTALASATAPTTKASADFIFAKISSRMAEQLREAVQERGQVSDEDSEIAMAEVVTAVRDLAQTGEILLKESETA
ncbi:FliG C-terminal domain-containing protein [Planktotalea sp.]|uniref:FliG C-terminal domain-containing protein n=1 Tax=Planktotalea sp. TaxID=2029877 RepID=UPI0035C7EC2A